MHTLADPLSEEEMDALDHFLLHRGGETGEADTGDVEGVDEGILCLSELDGFLTAVVSGPVTLPPSHWLPAVWGDSAPMWESEDEFQQVFTLIARQMNDVIGSLTDPDYRFEPIFNEHTIDGNDYLVVDEWCAGYMRGVALAEIEWDRGGEDLVELLAPILMFATEQGWELLEGRSDDEVAALQETIPDTAAAIYRFWLARRAPRPEAAQAPQVGDDEPCPCGSGLIYRHCCMQ